MRIGIALPQLGAIAGPDAITSVARRAEELGFDSIWVLDRLLYPVNPRAPYPVGDGSLPSQYKRVLDPIETLTFAAARAERIAVGTGVLDIPWYNPVLLARRLATLDVLPFVTARSRGFPGALFCVTTQSWRRRFRHPEQLSRTCVPIGLLGFRSSIASEGRFFAPVGDARVSIVDVRDIAAVAAASLTQNGHEGKTYDITGPEALTHSEIASALTTVLGKPVTFFDVPEAVMRDGLLSFGFPHTVDNKKAILNQIKLRPRPGRRHNSLTICIAHSS